MRYVVLGGGIAAVQCVEALARLLPNACVFLISGTRVIKGIENSRRLSRIAEDFDVVEKDLHALPYPNVTALQGSAESIDTKSKAVFLKDGNVIQYDKLCICTGAKPRKVLEHPAVVVLRDQDTVDELRRKLQKARTVILVGNGGIAMELAYALQGIKIIWVVKQGHIGDAFFDSDAAAFLGNELDRSRAVAEAPNLAEQNGRQHGSHLALNNWSEPVSVSVHKGQPKYLEFGHAVGPHWAASLPKEEQGAQLQLECNCTVSRVYEGSGEYAVKVDLSNGKTIEGDFIVSAVGVVPNTEWLGDTVKLHPEDRGILVDRHMESSIRDVYAAGDACCVDWADLSPQWVQMRLWTQAKVMGVYAAHCMADTSERDALSFSFELFAHVTRFLGMKVVLLGLYNGQKIPESEARKLVSYSRCVEGPNGHFVRVLLHNHRMVGAVLIGETELEETFENLILDGLDLSRYGPSILDPDVEIDALFD